MGRGCDGTPFLAVRGSLDGFDMMGPKTRSVGVGLLAGAVGCALALQSALTATAQTEKILHSFGSGTDGQTPYAHLIDVNGTLYGTTYYGGTNGDGTVFSFDLATHAETTLYSFCGRQYCADGANPNASLIDVNGMLYGTTYNGGVNDYGTVFALNPSTGAETVLYSFCSQQNCTDGENPEVSLIEMKDKLYGTTPHGGTNGYGTVFAIDPTTGTETVLYSFCSAKNCADGYDPGSSLIHVNGILYGTTEAGGTANGGTVYTFDPRTRVETVLYSFCQQQYCADGGEPIGNVINVGSTLYGTTFTGGAHNSGELYSLNLTTGAEQVVYSFCSQGGGDCTDGDKPNASVVNVRGTLYGTTFGGGDGDGTVFAFDPITGTETVLYSFCAQSNCTDGASPWASVIRSKGGLYGTTAGGGAHNDGTMFVIRRF